MNQPMLTGQHSISYRSYLINSSYSLFVALRMYFVSSRPFVYRGLSATGLIVFFIMVFYISFTVQLSI